jgi:hypothetical protein
MVKMLERIGYRQVKAWTTSRRAVLYRDAIRQYERGSLGSGFADKPVTLRDRLFGVWESLLVSFGMAVGEEIIVVAYKDRSEVQTGTER